MDLTIRPAASDADFAAAVTLQREFLAWREVCYAAEREVLYKYDHPSNYEADLAATPKKFGLPDGTFLVARHGDTLLGGVGLRRIAPGVCEMKRLWVREAGRGIGLGRTLSLALMEQGRAMGFVAMRLDTGFRQPKAIAIYEGLGFRRIPAYYPCPPDLEAILTFMEREI